MEDELECPICVERFDAQQRRPKMLHCGHTLCAQCITAITVGDAIKCPTDREVTRTGPQRPLRDNFYLLSLLDRHRNATHHRFWCEDCDKAADVSCQALHATRRLSRSYQESLEIVVGQQRDRLDALLALGASLNEYVRSATQAVRDQLQRAQRCLCRVSEWGEERDEEAQRRIKSDASKTLSSCGGGALEQELRLLDHDQLRVSLRVTAPVPNAPPMCGQVRAGWRGDDIAVEESPALRMALLQLLRLERLQPVQPQESETGERPAVEHIIEKLDASLATYAEEKQRILQMAKHRVRILNNVWCASDPTWALTLLTKLGPHLEELRVFDVDQEHLLAVQGMPRLRRLEVWNWRASMNNDPFVFSDSRHRLTWMEVWLPCKTVESLLYVNRHSLEEVRLSVPVPDTHEAGEMDTEAWPQASRELPALLGRCGLNQLRVLTLLRFVYPCNGSHACAAQLASVRRVLPATCYVECDECSR